MYGLDPLVIGVKGKNTTHPVVCKIEFSPEFSAAKSAVPAGLSHSTTVTCAQTVAAMAAVTNQQIAQGIYISRHLIGDAIYEITSGFRKTEAEGGPIHGNSTVRLGYICKPIEADCSEPLIVRVEVHKCRSAEVQK